MGGATCDALLAAMCTAHGAMLLGCQGGDTRSLHMASVLGLNSLKAAGVQGTSGLATLGGRPLLCLPAAAKERAAIALQQEWHTEGVAAGVSGSSAIEAGIAAKYGVPVVVLHVHGEVVGTERSARVTCNLWPAAQQLQPLSLARSLVLVCVWRSSSGML
jgi:hypothetical protein